PLFVGRSAFDYLVEIDSATTLRVMKPDFGKLGELPVRGVIVTARSDQTEFDFVSRFFAPASGVNEDPVTGSAHCTLGPFWQERLNKSDFRAYQACARGGVVKVRVGGGRVFVCGDGVTVLCGELYERHANQDNREAVRWPIQHTPNPSREARVGRFAQRAFMPVPLLGGGR